MLRSSSLTLALGVIALTFAYVSPSVAADQARALITQPINDGARVTLSGNTRPEANATNDRGLVSDSLVLDHMQLTLQRPAEREQALENLIDQMHDRNSPNYHKWLTPADFGKQFGPSPSDVQKVTGWLTAHGFTVNVVYPSGMLIDFTGTAGRVRTAFGTEIHNLSVNGQKHIANMRDPQIPAALAPAVGGIVSLHNFMPHPALSSTTKPTPISTSQLAKSNTTITGCESYGFPVPECNIMSPGDITKIYNINPVLSGGNTGQGTTIVLIEDTNVAGGSANTDWTLFRSEFGVTGTGTFTQVNPATGTGVNNCGNPGDNGDDVEASLDIEWSSAAAPGANIVLAACLDTATSFGGLIAFNNLINTTPPTIVSISYGECETFLGATANAAFNSAYQQAAAEGVSVFVSAGDQMASQCDRSSFATHGIGASGFASSQYDVNVGGTDFGDTYAGTQSAYWTTAGFPASSALSYVPEIPWNSGCASILTASFFGGSPVTYGKNGFCNHSNIPTYGTAGGSGGPSGCATGTPSIPGVVSGSCKGFAKPSWQMVFGNPKDGVRDTPDVSLFASFWPWGHSYIITYFGGFYFGYGGTSFASPIMAGIQALVDHKQQSVSNPDGRQGNPNPVYYALANAEYGSHGNAACNSTLGSGIASTCVFNNVTQGDMDAPCEGKVNCYLPSGTEGVLSTNDKKYLSAYNAGKGWNFATGLGSVNAANLVGDWP